MSHRKQPTHPARAPESEAHRSSNEHAKGLETSLTGLAGGLEAVERSVKLPEPPRRAFRTDDGETVFEDLTLVGWVEAPRSARDTLELYGIDVSLAHFNVLNGRWEGCFFSEQVADMLVELAEEGQFPHAFEAVPSWATLDWWVRESQGEQERPAYEIFYYCEPASPAAIRAWTARTGKDPARRAAPSKPRSARVPEDEAGVWIRTRDER